MKDKVAILTGATSMIGRACARLFSEHGMKIMLVGRSLEKLEKIANDLPGIVEIYSLGSLSENEIKTMVLKTISLFGHIDVVVQNVAIYPWKCIDELTLDDWQGTLETNLTKRIFGYQSFFFRNEAA